MPLCDLNFINNPIESIDDDIFANDDALVMRLSIPSLSSVPVQTSGTMPYLFRLFLQYTNLTEVPLYIREWYRRGDDALDHSLFGGPYCARELVDADDEERAYQDQVCDDSRNHSVEYYKLSLITPQRPWD